MGAQPIDPAKYYMAWHNEWYSEGAACTGTPDVSQEQCGPGSAILLNHDGFNDCWLEYGDSDNYVYISGPWINSNCTN